MPSGENKGEFSSDVVIGIDGDNSVMCCRDDGATNPAALGRLNIEHCAILVNMRNKRCVDDVISVVDGKDACFVFFPLSVSASRFEFS